MKWIDKNGNRIKVKDMTDEHLKNTIHLLLRQHKRIRNKMISSISQAYNFLQGEQALISVENAEHQLNGMTNLEIVEEAYPIFIEMRKEAEKRILNIEYDDIDNQNPLSEEHNFGT